MSKGNRSNVVAYFGGLGLAFIAGVAVTSLDYRGDYQESYPGYADIPEHTVPRLTSGEAGVGAIQKKVPCINTKGRDESGLCAQWRAANAEKQAANWSLWQLVFSVFGLIGLSLTLWFNKRVIEIALESAKETEAALTHARKVARADLRPWLLYCGFEINRFTNGVINDEHISRGLLARMQLINSGKSPAARVKLFSSHCVLPITQAPPLFDAILLHDTATESVSYGTVGPGRPVSGQDQGLGILDTDAIMERRSCLWLYAKAEYQDPGHEGDDYVSEVCMRIIYNGDEVGPNGTKTPRFIATLVGNQNTLQ